MHHEHIMKRKGGCEIEQGLKEERKLMGPVF